MAVDSYDPISGRPIFLDGGAPDIAVDPTEVGKYAEEVGHVISGTTAYRDAYPFARKGLLCSNTTTDSVDYHNGTGWAPLVYDTGWRTLTLAAGATVYDGKTPRVRRKNGVVYLRGAVTAPPAGTFTTLDSGDRPATDLRLIVPDNASFVTARAVTVSTLGAVFTSASQTVYLDGLSWSVG